MSKISVDLSIFPKMGLVALVFAAIAVLASKNHFVALLMPTLIGCCIFSLGYYKNRIADSVASWPTVSGRVTISEYTEYIEPATPARIHYYVPIVSFQYTVADNIYVSDKLGLYPKDYQSEDKSEVLKLLAKFPIDSSVVVFYSPNNPNLGLLFSQILPRRKSHLQALKVSGMAITLIGLLLVYLELAH